MDSSYIYIYIYIYRIESTLNQNLEHIFFFLSHFPAFCNIDAEERRESGAVGLSVICGTHLLQRNVASQCQGFLRYFQLETCARRCHMGGE